MLALECDSARVGLSGGDRQNSRNRRQLIGTTAGVVGGLEITGEIIAHSNMSEGPAIAVFLAGTIGTTVAGYFAGRSARTGESLGFEWGRRIVQPDPTALALLQQVPGPDHINNFLVGDSSSGLLRNIAGYAFNIRNNRTQDHWTGKLDYARFPCSDPRANMTICCY